MFKGQSLTFSFRSYLKKQEKTTSKTKWLRCADDAMEMYMFRRARGDIYFPDANQISTKRWDENISSGATKAIIRVLTWEGWATFSAENCLRTVHKLALRGFVHPLISCSHDAALSLYLAKLFLIDIDIHIFNIHPTLSYLISNLVTIWPVTRDRHTHPGPLLIKKEGHQHIPLKIKLKQIIRLLACL